MITEDQYQEALRVIEAYEYEQKVLNEPDDDFEDEEPEECDECGRIHCVCSLAEGCHCGAWQMSKEGRLIHVADCCC
jgi:hypothetical protein